MLINNISNASIRFTQILVIALIGFSLYSMKLIAELTIVVNTHDSFIIELCKGNNSDECKKFIELKGRIAP
jgi:hypothetical protein